MKQTRIAVIGGGAIGRTHAVAIRDCPGTELAAIVDPFEAGAALAGELEALHLTELDALFDTRIDGAVIATPNALHVPQATMLIEAGIPVLVEKPLGENAAACRALVSLSEHTGVPGLVGHHRRHNPIIRAAKCAIEDGRFGALVSGTISATLHKADSYFDVAWRREKGSGGPVLINLIHEIDLVRHLFGEIGEVFAMASNDRRGFEVEDTAVILLRLSGGGMVTVALTDAGVGPWCWDTTAGENLARFPAMPAVSHMFAGTRAGMSLPDLSFWTHDGPADWTVPQVNRPLEIVPMDSYVKQIRHFAAVIAGEERPRITLADGAANIAVIEAIRTSVAQRRPVAPDLTGQDAERQTMVE
ncbi:Gfo/Idh/MocA family protein [Celeribacter indicus]|uniref:Oxidoreductase domain-containing protein n=1 Tax=Celeribacter indicus TaxID=1208324 RepID=A0A0B5DVS9_9RHOB|nr:Gfo/Idh/MocA family oxidoreductase [Celeribacter indicus]AJE44866.1 oxidoreductase domain-containing protein [Celeribacter indicus]SDX23190.1 Predicted dehydrogenase [Celeribacter indicus]